MKEDFQLSISDFHSEIESRFKFHLNKQKCEILGKCQNKEFYKNQIQKKNTFHFIKLNKKKKKLENDRQFDFLFGFLPNKTSYCLFFNQRKRKLEASIEIQGLLVTLLLIFKEGETSKTKSEMAYKIAKLSDLYCNSVVASNFMYNEVFNLFLYTDYFQKFKVFFYPEIGILFFFNEKLIILSNLVFKK